MQTKDSLYFYIFSMILFEVRASRHLIYWDKNITPTLLKGLEIEVRINDWMDISCPRYPLQEDDKKRELMHRHNNQYYLQLYNVTHRDFSNCVTMPDNRVLSCKDPSKESKLTTKFQRISPSPLGFVFKPGHTYYYVSRLIHDKNTKGCNNSTMRLAVRVHSKIPAKNPRGKDTLRTYHLVQTDHNNYNFSREKFLEEGKKSSGNSANRPSFTTLDDEEDKKNQPNTKKKPKSSRIKQNPGNLAGKNRPFYILTLCFCFLISYYIL